MPSANSPLTATAPLLWVVYLDNAPWLLMPLAIIARMYGSEHPFTREKQEVVFEAGVSL